MKNWRSGIWNIQQNFLSLCYKDKGKRAERINHIKVDWETHQFYMKYRDKLSCPMAGPNRFSERWLITQADYKGGELSNPVIRSFIASFGVVL